MKFSTRSLLVVMGFMAMSGILQANIISEALPSSRGLQLGDSRARLHAGVGAGVTYDDNIYLSSNDVKHDWITLLTPMAAVVVPLDESKFVAEYRFSDFLYSKYTTEDHPDHMAKALLEVNLTDYQIKLDEQYDRFTNRASMEGSYRIRQSNNDLRVGISKINVNRFGFDVGYSNKIENYLSNEVITGGMTYADKDRMFHIVDTQFLYKFAPKTTFIVEADLGAIRYDSDLNPNAFYVEPLVGLKGELTNKVTVEVRGGYRHQQYDTSALVTNENFNGPVIRGWIAFQATKDDLINLTGERSVYESLYRNLNYYTGGFTRLMYKHVFSDKWFVSPYFFYRLNSYPEATTEASVTQKRRDNYIGGGIGLNYTMQEWIAFQVKYDYKSNDSNFNEFDYKDNTLGISMVVGF